MPERNPFTVADQEARKAAVQARLTPADQSQNVGAADDAQTVGGDDSGAYRDYGILNVTLIEAPFILAP